MPLNDARIKSDFTAIMTDLAGTSVIEEVSRIPAGETAIERTFDVARTRQKTKEELLPTGYSKEYQFSCYAITDDAGPTTEGDVIVMADGTRLRVFRKTPGPATIITAFDLGDEFEDGDAF